MSIFTAFRDYERKLHPLPPVPGGRAWTPVVISTFEDRASVMARIRAAYPEVWYRREPPPAEHPLDTLARLATGFQNTPVSASWALLAQYGIRPPQPTPGEEAGP